MEIKLGRGVDSIIFGTRENQIVANLGEPNKTYFTDGENKRLQFNGLLLELSFEIENGNRLGWIEVHNPDVALFGKKLIGKSYSEVLTFITSKLDEQPEIEDYGSFLSAIYDSKLLELQFSFNKLTNINFGVLYGDNDEPIWPST